VPRVPGRPPPRADRRPPLPDPLALPWRHGRHRPRHVYAQAGEPDDSDQEVAWCETAEIAAEVIAAHNARLGEG
jgi:hypothetical protein